MNKEQREKHNKYQREWHRKQRIKNPKRYAYKKRKWDKDRKCLICDKKYVAITDNQRYCGKKCYLKNQAEKYNYHGAWGLRFKVLKRDSFTCQYCGRKAPNVELQVDHKYPKSKGGKLTLNNLITACKECNIGKQDIILNS